MTDIISGAAVLSPLAIQLQALISQGIVTPSKRPENLFPSAMVVVPVYDSTGTGLNSGPFQISKVAR